MAENQKPTYDLSNATFGGGFAAEGGTQIGGTYNDFSQTINNNLDEIRQLMDSLRSQAESFLEDKRDEVKVHLSDLENDFQQPEKRDPKRVRASLAALLAISVALGGGVATATDFTNNVLELSKKFGIELMQPQPARIDVQSIDFDSRK